MIRLSTEVENDSVEANLFFLICRSLVHTFNALFWEALNMKSILNALAATSTVVKSVLIRMATSRLGRSERIHIKIILVCPAAEEKITHKKIKVKKICSNQREC